jgi:thiamine biosynthesis lipoprotein
VGGDTQPTARQHAWLKDWRGILLVLALAAAGFVAGRVWTSTSTRADLLATRTRLLMGTLVEIRLPMVAGTIDESAVAAAFDEVARVERVFSPDKPGGGPADAAESREVDRIVELGRHVSTESGGVLDLRMRDWVELWGFEATPRRPSDDELSALKEKRQARAATGPLTEYVFGSVAKGYAVDRALAVLGSHGVSRALVNAGGEIGVLGRDWVVGVQHPRNHGALLASVRLAQGQAMATSGDYENYFVVDGRRYHHLLVPGTGLPAMESQSVSVLAPSCMEADIWATAFFVMGPTRAMAAVASQPGLAILVVDSNGRVLHSPGWNADVPHGRP